MILLNDEILAARDATKSNAVRPNAFSAPYRGDLGLAEPEGIVFHRPASRRAVFDVSAVRELPRVDIAYSYAGADGAGIDAFVAAGAKGIVVAGSGRGATTGGERQAIERALSKGVIVVIGTRTGSGTVPVGDGVRGTNGAAVDDRHGRSQSTEGARVAHARAHAHDRPSRGGEDLSGQSIEATSDCLSAPRHDICHSWRLTNDITPTTTALVIIGDLSTGLQIVSHVAFTAR